MTSPAPTMNTLLAIAQHLPLHRQEIIDDIAKLDAQKAELLHELAQIDAHLAIVTQYNPPTEET